MTARLPLAICVVLSSTSLSAKSIEEIYKGVRPTVAVITNSDSLGSGFVVDSKGLLVTNNHVVSSDNVLVSLEGRKAPLAAVVVARDPDWDVAIVALPAGTYKSVKLAASSARVGQGIAVIGNPQGLEATISSGIVSGMRDLGNGTSLIQISAPISPGSSGGPVLDLEGRVLGVASLQLVDGQNLNFAVPIAAAAALLKIARNVAKPVPTLTTGSTSSRGDSAAGPDALAAWFRSFQAAADELAEGKADTHAVQNSYISIDAKFYASVETIAGLRNDLERLLVAPALRGVLTRLRTAVSLKLDEATLFEQGCRAAPAAYSGELERSEAKRLLSEREVVAAAQVLLLHLRMPRDRAFVARFSIAPHEFSRFLEFSESLPTESAAEIHRNPWAFWWLKQGRPDLARDTCEEQEPSVSRRLECAGGLAKQAAQSRNGDLAVDLLNYALVLNADPDAFVSSIEERVVADVGEALLESGDHSSTVKVLASAERELRGRTFIFGNGTRLLGVYRRTGRLKEGAAFFGASAGPEAFVAAVALNADMGNLRAARSILASEFPASTSRLDRALLDWLVVREGLAKVKPDWTRADHARCIDAVRAYPIYAAIGAKVADDYIAWSNEGHEDATKKEKDAKLKELRGKTTERVAALRFPPSEPRADLEARLPLIGHGYAGTPGERTLVGASLLLASFLSQVEGGNGDADDASADEVAMARRWLEESDAGVVFPEAFEKLKAEFKTFLEQQPNAAPSPQ